MENKSNNHDSDLTPGDKVLLKQEQRNKLSKPFASELMTLVPKEEGSVLIQSPEDVQLMCNTTCKEVQ